MNFRKRLKRKPVLIMILIEWEQSLYYGHDWSNNLPAKRFPISVQDIRKARHVESHDK